VTVRSRPSQALPYLLAFVLGLGAAGLTACGKTNQAMIPATNADELKADLDAVLAAIDSHDCTKVGPPIAQVKSDLLELPEGTSKRLEQKLEEGVAKLEEQATKECVTETETTETTPTETTQTETLPTTTTETTPPTTPTETTPPTVPTTPTTPTTTTPVQTTTDDTGGVSTP
jgi:septal ring-binding cell division protein DamX